MASAVENYAKAVFIRDNLGRDLERLAALITDVGEALSKGRLIFDPPPTKHPGDELLRIDDEVTADPSDWKTVAEIRELLANCRQAVADANAAYENLSETERMMVTRR